MASITACPKCGNRVLYESSVVVSCPICGWDQYPVIPSVLHMNRPPQYSKRRSRKAKTHRCTPLCALVIRGFREGLSYALIGERIGKTTSRAGQIAYDHGLRRGRRGRRAS